MAKDKLSYKQMKVFKAIIEGSNISGKDSIGHILEQQFTECTKVVIHSYYRPGLAQMFQSRPEKMIEYGQKRLSLLLPLFLHSLDPLIFLRFHITDWVYLKLFYQQANLDYQKIEDQLNQAKVALVVLTLSDQAIEKRLEERKRQGKTGPWDKDKTSLIEKRDAYQEVFQKSRIKHKLLLGTSSTIPSEAAEKIIQWWHSLKL